MDESHDKIIADRVRLVRDVVDDATADEDEVVVLMTAMTMMRAIVLGNVQLASIEPLREMVQIGDEFTSILLGAELAEVHRSAELAHRRRRDLRASTRKPNGEFGSEKRST
jgi:hypothetical protein